MSGRVFGWDIGGAHLKLAAIEGGRVVAARQLPCALWRGLDELHRAAATALAGLGAADRHAVTMTGELADLFADRPSGVAAILGVLGEFAPRDAIAVYVVDGRFVSADEALAATDRVASANWHATGQFLARSLGDGLLIDIGSTTTDIVPFRGGKLASRGAADAERLATCELVYSGVVRTPLCAIARDVPFRGKRLGIMAEFFATAADAHRLARTLPEGADLHATADNRGKSLPESRARLARMIGMDAAAASDDAWDRLAEAFVRQQIRQIEGSVETVLSAADLTPAAPVVGAGSGRFIAAEIARRLGRPYRAFESTVPIASPDLSPAAADIAPAVAVGLLAASIA
jgi:probable H4MPT-linked C1 transfer pathway protein